MKLTAAKEKSIREALGTKVALVTGSAFVRRPLIDSKQDWVTLLGVVNADDEYEIKYCTVDLAGFNDSDQEGCDDDPVVTITYQCHLFHEYKETRVADSSNSTDDFNAAFLTLRNTFLDDDRSLAALDRVESLPLAQTAFIILGTDTLTGAFGHYVDFTIAVELR